VGGGGHRERVKEGEYGGSTCVFMYQNGTMRPVETVLRKRGRGIKEKKDGGCESKIIL
jgi:hypothetical protein